MEMLREKLEQHLKDELEDVISYDMLANHTKDQSERRLFHKIRDDEFSHAEVILSILESYGYEVEKHPEISVLWEKVEEL